MAQAYDLYTRDEEDSRNMTYAAGQDGAVAEFGANDAFPIEDIDEIIPGLIEG